ncbi:RUN and FYVE domain-containing protein 2-like isoform X2 [Daktulosphaira vitifoliae]|uniref:RUN and FYVE domain-containing protein 2-like isoform X2 n=1 Tax=Daktulosphaira vitifoliae TaxID=58002 RepID=UPI0021AAA2B5|nr:RUN and FYVE domain-containing protein 2-like isoform X2 [Daktulosphaira vitifoliae]
MSRISNGTLLHPNNEFLMNRPNSCSTKSLHEKSCPMYLKVSSFKTIEQCREKIEELEKQNIRLISKVKVLKYQLKASTSLYNNIHQRPEKPISRLSQRSTPIKQNLSRLSRVDFEENTKTILLPERKFESTESFDSDNSLIDNKSKLRENIEIIHSHRVFKSMQIKLDTLEAQCKSLEQNLLDADKLLQKEKDIQERLTKDLIRERHTLSEIKPKLNSCKETNRALEEQIRDLQKEKSSLKDHNQKLLLLTSKPHNNGLKLKELEDNFTNSRASLLKQMDENNKYIAELITENEHFKNQNLELSQILESKEKEIQQNLKQSLEAAEKYKIKNDLSRINDNQTVLDQPNIDTDDKRLKSQIEDLQQAQAKINQALVSQSYLNNKMKDKVDKLKSDLKIATELLKNLLSLFTGIISQDLIWPIITTTEVVEKAINVMKKNADININNIDLEDVIKKVMDILNDFRDKIIKKHTVFNQEQLFLTTSNLNQNHLSNHLIDEQIHFSNATQNNIPQFEVHMQNLTFSDESLLYLKYFSFRCNYIQMNFYLKI